MLKSNHTKKMSFDIYVKTENWNYTCSEVLTESSAAFIPSIQLTFTQLDGCNLVGDTEDVTPHFFRRGDIICHVPLAFLFGEVSKIKVMLSRFV